MPGRPPRRPLPHRRPWLALVVSAVAVSGPLARLALAAPEGGTMVTIDLGPAALREDGRWRGGAQVGFEGQYGFAEPWSVRAAVHLGGFPPGAERAARTATGELGLVYSLDVLQVVPFAELSLAVLSLRGQLGDARELAVSGGVQLGAGASYLLDRRWAVGGVLRAQYFGLRLTSDRTGGTAPLLLGGLVRLERYF